MRRRGLLAVFVGALLSPVSYAQGVPGAVLDASAVENDSTSRVGEILVSAQRRTEKLQDIPLAVQAFLAETARDLGL